MCTATHTKFGGRCILHEWSVDVVCHRNEWYRGAVLDVMKGHNGSPPVHGLRFSMMEKTYPRKLIICKMSYRKVV